jgi:hypothetical protein
MNNLYDDQAVVWAEVGPALLSSAMDGIDASFVALGQTGSGKSQTLFGDRGPDYGEGVTQIFARELFERIDGSMAAEITTSVEISIVQLYKEEARDMLAAVEMERAQPTLRVFDDKTVGVGVEGLSWHLVNKFSEVEEMLDYVQCARTVLSQRWGEDPGWVNLVVQFRVRHVRDPDRREDSDPDEFPDPDAPPPDPYAASSANATRRQATIQMVELAGHEVLHHQRGSEGIRDHLRGRSQIHAGVEALEAIIHTLKETPGSAALLQVMAQGVGGRRGGGAEGATGTALSTALVASTGDEAEDALAAVRAAQKAAGINPLTGMTAEQEQEAIRRAHCMTSVLTLLMRNVLGGSGRLMVMAHVSPASTDALLTLGTLRASEEVEHMRASVVRRARWGPAAMGGPPGGDDTLEELDLSEPDAKNKHKHKHKHKHGDKHGGHHRHPAGAGGMVTYDEGDEDHSDDEEEQRQLELRQALQAQKAAELAKMQAEGWFQDSFELAHLVRLQVNALHRDMTSAKAWEIAQQQKAAESEEGDGGGKKHKKKKNQAALGLGGGFSSKKRQTAIAARKEADEADAEAQLVEPKHPSAVLARRHEARHALLNHLLMSESGFKIRRRQAQKSLVARRRSLQALGLPAAYYAEKEEVGRQALPYPRALCKSLVGAGLAVPPASLASGHRACALCGSDVLVPCFPLPERNVLCPGRRC